MAVRMLRLGDETGRLPVLASRIAEFYEAKLPRSLDRLVYCRSGSYYRRSALWWEV
jgi:type II secretory pathway component PulF